jgi:hypothetical protein
MLSSGELILFSNKDLPNSIKFNLAEQPPTYTTYSRNAGVSITSALIAGQTSASLCYCAWWAQ